MTGDYWMNRELERLRAIGAVFGFQWFYSEAAPHEKAAQSMASCLLRGCDVLFRIALKRFFAGC
jgi:hypothetical protein